MTQPTVSVVIPVYNTEQFIGTAIRSVLDQQGVSLQLIIADDGSTDQTLAAARAAIAGDPRASVLALDHVGMPGVVRNAGARAAIGSYIAFLDADDSYLPGRLSEAVDVLERLPKVAGVFQDHYRTTEQTPTQFGATHLTSLGFRERARGVITADGRGLYRTTDGFYGYMCLNGLPMHTNTMTVRRRVFEELKGFAEHLRYNQDEDLWFRLAKDHNLAYIDKPAACFWQRPNSHTGASRRSAAIGQWGKFYRTNISLHESNFARGSSRLTAQERRAYRKLIAARWCDLAYVAFLADAPRKDEISALASAFRWAPAPSMVRMFVRALAPKGVRARYRANATPIPGTE
jgi:glycosyltransferase involved in cell wall biosynthesis